MLQIAGFIVFLIAQPVAAPAMAASSSHQGSFVGVRKGDPGFRQMQVFNAFQEAWMRADPDPKILMLTARKERLQESLPGIAHRQPFDAALLNRDYTDYVRTIGDINVRNAELLVQRLAALPAEDRVLVIDRLPYLATVPVPSPPKPQR